MTKFKPGQRVTVKRPMYTTIGVIVEVRRSGFRWMALVRDDNGNSVGWHLTRNIRLQKGRS